MQAPVLITFEEYRANVQNSFARPFPGYTSKQPGNEANQLSTVYSFQKQIAKQIATFVLMCGIAVSVYIPMNLQKEVATSKLSVKSLELHTSSFPGA